MGYKHIDLIESVPNLTPPQSAVLTYLAYHANTNGLSFPGIRLLARKTRYCEREIRYVLRQLESLKLITKTKGTYATHYRTAYIMTYAEISTPEPVEPPPPPPPPNGRAPGQRRNDLVGLFSKEKSPK